MPNPNDYFNRDFRITEENGRNRIQEARSTPRRQDEDQQNDEEKKEARVTFEGLMDTTSILESSPSKKTPPTSASSVHFFEMLQQGVAQVARIRELLEEAHHQDEADRRRREPQWSAARHQNEPLNHIG